MSLTAEPHLARPPWWYFALALVMVPALWLPALAALAAVLDAGTAGATLAAVTTGVAGVSTVAWVGADRGYSWSWVLSAAVAAVPAGAFWAFVEVWGYLAIVCPPEGCFN